MNTESLFSLARTLLVAAGFIAAATAAPAQIVAPTAPTAPRPGEPAPGPATAPAPAGPVPSASITPVPGAAASSMPAGPLPSSPSLPSSTPSAAPLVPGAGAPATAPGGPAATPAALVRFTGELLDVRSNYVYFTTGDAFKTTPALRIVDFDTGGPTTLAPAPRLFARATLDPASGSVVELALTKRRLPTDAAYRDAYARAHSYAITGSPTIPAPELLHGQRLTGRPVAVTFFVQVPPTTPLTDNVYLTTDASGWVPNAMRMDRIDALHYRLTRTYASGTKFAYRYTRGDWNSVEVGEDGLQGDAHAFFVPEVDAKRLTDVVYRWSDQNPTAPQVGPDSIPTPYNPNPFGGLPSIVRPGIPAATPTPRP